MVITIKHSGSLVTLSAQGFAAKNSLDNEFTAGAAVLLHAHFVRLLGSEDAALQRLAAFMEALQQRQLAISFEMVTGEPEQWQGLIHSFPFGVVLADWFGTQAQLKWTLWLVTGTGLVTECVLTNHCMIPMCPGRLPWPLGQLSHTEHLLATSAHFTVTWCITECSSCT
jgi:hypothetical protein